MTRIQIDAKTAELLRAAKGGVVLCDEDDNELCRIPHAGLTALSDAALVPPMDPDEMRRLADEPGGRPLSEIWHDLEAHG